MVRRIVISFKVPLRLIRRIVEFRVEHVSNPLDGIHSVTAIELLDRISNVTS